MTELGERTLSGYDVIALIHKKFNILVSSGTIYSLLYSLERDGLIEGIWNQRKRIYKLTEKGERNSGLVMKANQELHSFMKSISLLDAGNHH